MELSEIKTGYQFLQKPKPEINDYSSWMGPIVLFFINIWNKIYKRGICEYTHSFTVAWIDGELWAFEAVSPVYRKILFSEKLKEVDPDRLIILIPQFNYDSQILINNALHLVKISLPYDYRGLTLSQAIFQATDERLWIGSRNIKHSAFCTKACGYLKYKATVGVLFKDFYNLSPNDFYKSILFKKEYLQKII